MVKEEAGFKRLVKDLKAAFKPHNKQTEEAIRRAGSDWYRCLEKAEGNIEEARKLYDNL